MDFLLTRYGAALNRKDPLSEYPRPQMMRNSYLSLNGVWSYAVTASEQQPENWDGDILVPFPLESGLSGVGATLQPGQVLWYRRGFSLPPGFLAEHLLLHFGAVDERCKIFINGQLAGGHEGGFLPFELDITALLREEENELVVMVQDDTEITGRERGRQALAHEGRLHRPVSGIWQTVWLESVPQGYIQNLKITPQYDDSSVEILVEASEQLEGKIEIFANSTLAAASPFQSGQAVSIHLPGALSWRPDKPFLYKVRIAAGADVVGSYFGMRKLGIGPDKQGHMRLLLNNKPFIHVAVADQGLFSDGLYTAPSDRAMVDDIRFAKRCGFNAIRKMGKIEPLRWYYHCDRLGMLVWQDLPAGGEAPKKGLSGLLGRLRHNRPDNRYRATGRSDPDNRRRFLEQMEGAARLLYNSACLAVWVLFNEGEGQFDAEQVARQLHGLDATRLIDHASGWYDQGAGDIASLHALGGKLSMPGAEENRAVVFSAVGGFGSLPQGHFAGNTPFEQPQYDAPQQLQQKLEDLYRQLVPLVGQGLAGFVYLQLTDAEDETSGLRSADRRLDKLDPELLKKWNASFSMK